MDGSPPLRPVPAACRLGRLWPPGPREGTLPGRMDITRTRHGLRLSQHGVVISELRTTAGPTHSVFDLLAALVVLFGGDGRAGVLGFAGGGMMAPLDALGHATPFDAVDLDRDAYRLFREHCPAWRDRVRWHHGEASAWLRARRGRFGLLVDDLSVPRDGDVFKPDVSWDPLPGLIRRRLRPGGTAVWNLLVMPGDRWGDAVARVSAGHREVRVLRLDEFENRIVVAGDVLPDAAALGRSLRGLLRGIRSRQADRFRVEDVRGRLRAGG